MHKFNFDILDFVKTGNFCNIDLGISKKKLLSIGFTPNDWLNGKNIENSTMWIFGNIEFYFDDNNLLEFIVSSSVNYKLEGGNKIKISNYWILNRRKVTLSKTIKELLNLSCDFNLKLINPGFLKLILSNGVYFLFDFINNETENYNNWTMTSIGKKKK